MSEEELVLIGFLTGSIDILKDNNIQFTEKSRNKLADKIEELLKLYQMEEDNYKVLLEDNVQAFKELGLPEDTIVADELVLEINKRYISKDKIKTKMEELKKEMLEENINLEEFNKKRFCYEVLQNLLEEK